MNRVPCSNKNFQAKFEFIDGWTEAQTDNTTAGPR